MGVALTNGGGSELSVDCKKGAELMQTNFILRLSYDVSMKNYDF